MDRQGEAASANRSFLAIPILCRSPNTSDAFHVVADLNLILAATRLLSCFDEALRLSYFRTPWERLSHQVTPLAGEVEDISAANEIFWRPCLDRRGKPA